MWTVSLNGKLWHYSLIVSKSMVNVNGNKWVHTLWLTITQLTIYGMWHHASYVVVTILIEIPLMSSTLRNFRKSTLSTLNLKKRKCGQIFSNKICQTGRYMAVALQLTTVHLGYRVKEVKRLFSSVNNHLLCLTGSLSMQFSLTKILK